MSTNPKDMKSAAELPAISSTRLAQSEVKVDTVVSKEVEDEADTVLYLAFGSNLNWKIMTQQKGAWPMAKVNVTAPTLQLVFDLPGLPFWSHALQTRLSARFLKIRCHPRSTPFQYYLLSMVRRIQGGRKGLSALSMKSPVATMPKSWPKEGGGTGYQEIFVPCIPLPPTISIPERPNPTVPRPFIARTLYLPDTPTDIPDVPETPDVPGKPNKPDDKEPKKSDDSVPQDGDDEEDPKKGWWTKLWLRLASPYKRPVKGYSEPSHRYLNLIVTGAAENELPEDYQQYLQSLNAYTRTSIRQRIGRLVTIATWLPYAIFLMLTGRLLADKDGRFPPWMGVVFHVATNCVWLHYDYIMKPLFGDGERTTSAEAGDLQNSAVVVGDEQAPDERKPLLA